MKLRKLLLAFLVMGLSGAALSSVNIPSPVISKVPVIAAYSPFGFDSNDNVEVMIEGYLPNLCYKSPVIKAKVTDDQINISVEAYRANQKGIVCLEMIVPFVERVSLGVLSEGNYKISVNEKIQSSISVAESSSPLIDEHIYANVSSIEKNEGSRKIILKGFNPSDCLELDKVKVVSNKVDVYSILPQMKKVNDFCPMKMVPFAYEVLIPNNLEAEKILLHVRAMDGRSVNSLFNNFIDELIEL